MTLAAEHQAQRAAYFAAAQGELIAALPADPHAAVLDLACGNGATGALALREGKCASYVGVEANPAAAGEARFALSDVIVGDLAALTLPWPAKTFDIVIAGTALAALADPPAFLARLVPIMRPGARLFATVPAGSRQDWPKLIRRAGLRLDAPKVKRGLLGRLFPPKRVSGGYELRAHRGWR
jgi:trans-aconitate methyltransferase